MEVGNEVLASVGLPDVVPIEYPCRVNVGIVVITIFGRGIVTNFRKSDGIYEIEISSGFNTQDVLNEHLSVDEIPPPLNKIKMFIPGFSIVA